MGFMKIYGRSKKTGEGFIQLNGNCSDRSKHSWCPGNSLAHVAIVTIPVGSGQCALASDLPTWLGSNTLPLFHMPHITVAKLRARLRRAIQGEHPSFSHL